MSLLLIIECKLSPRHGESLGEAIFLLRGFVFQARVNFDIFRKAQGGRRASKLAAKSICGFMPKYLDKSCFGGIFAETSMAVRSASSNPSTRHVCWVLGSAHVHFSGAAEFSAESQFSVNFRVGWGGGDETCTEISDLALVCPPPSPSSPQDMH